MSEERQKGKEPDSVPMAERVERAQRHIARVEEILKDNAEAADVMQRLGSWIAALLSRGSDR